MFTHVLLLAFGGPFVEDAHALNPSRTYKQRPEKFNMTYEQVEVPTNDGQAKLMVWDFPAKTKTTDTLLIAHNGEGNMADYLRRVDSFVDTHNVVVFDYRGFGESSDFEIDNNMFLYPQFLDDVQTMFDYVRKSHAATFDVYGWGVGAGLGLGVGWSRAETRRIIADTPFLSMEDLEERFSSWDEPMEVPFAGYDKRFEPVHAVASAPAKNLESVQLIIGSNDILFNKEDMAKLASSKPKSLWKKLVVIENPDRKDSYRVDRSAYAAVVDAALAR
jgi:pimeloyl-ACP methyl ester carboxylesterase